MREIIFYKKDIIKTIPKRFSPILSIKLKKIKGKFIASFKDFDGIVYESNGDYVFSINKEVIK